MTGNFRRGRQFIDVPPFLWQVPMAGDSSGHRPQNDTPVFCVILSEAKDLPWTPPFRRGRQFIDVPPFLRLPLTRELSRNEVTRLRERPILVFLLSLPPSLAALVPPPSSEGGFGAVPMAGDSSGYRPQNDTLIFCVILSEAKDLPWAPFSGAPRGHKKRKPPDFRPGANLMTF